MAGSAVSAGEEGAYRKLVDEALAKLDKAFENVDPDLAESDFSQGTLVIIFKQAHKLILSPQTPMRQIWAAFRDRAWHFDRDSATGHWMDDRGLGVELFGLVTDLAREHGGVELVI